MNGYWYGSYDGTNRGQMVVELDDSGDHFSGCAYLYDDDPSKPGTFAGIRTPNKERSQRLDVVLLPLHPVNLAPTDWQQIKDQFPNANFPTTAQVNCEWTDHGFTIAWKTNIGTSGTAHLPRGRAVEPSEYVSKPNTTWAQFKERILTLGHYRYMFRGQEQPWRLRTPFHRTGRGDMHRFFQVDVQTLRRHLSAHTSHFFDFRDDIQHAAFLHLIQHHGYPTPLLDWTYSPFVAAYFAYRKARPFGAGVAMPAVRVFAFDKETWCSDFAQIFNIWDRRPHFSILEPVSIENERMVPQQALSTFSSLDDIETYIAFIERTNGKRYLEVFDLPLDEREHVLQELRLMGISAGSMFPGLEGACEELRERFFKPQSSEKR